MQTTMEVEIISTETIKPSAPTPHHLKIYKVSMLDQCVPWFYAPVILFYPMNQKVPNTNRSLLLKQSLSEALAKFYPFAGRFRDGLSIDCNDEGACYSQARVNCNLSEFLRKTNFLASLDDFFPREAVWGEPSAGSHVILVQENTFQCGGTAIAVLISHGVVDGTGFCAFLQGWAALASKSDDDDKNIVLPNFDASHKFPQRNPYPREATFGAVWTPFIRNAKAATRRFVFDAPSITSLQARISSSNCKNPTRVEAVSALLWHCCLDIFKDTNKPTVISHTVNLRKRAFPPFPKCSVGNFLLPVTGVCSAGAEGAEMVSLARWLKQEIPKVDANLVRNLQGDGGLPEICRLFEGISEKMGSVASCGGQYLPISSWCNFDMYDVDFGFGKPSWGSVVGCSSSVPSFAPIIYLLDTKKPKGIEALVVLGEDELIVLENNKELLAYASVDPCPLDLDLPEFVTSRARL